MQGWWFDDRLRLNLFIYSVFMIFPLSLRDFIIVNEYVNQIIKVSDHKIKGL